MKIATDSKNQSKGSGSRRRSFAQHSHTYTCSPRVVAILFWAGKCVKSGECRSRSWQRTLSASGNKIREDFIVRFDRSMSLQRRMSNDKIIITWALVRLGYRILVEFKVIYLVNSCYLCLNVLSDSGDCYWFESEFQIFSVCLHVLRERSTQFGALRIYGV